MHVLPTCRRIHLFCLGVVSFHASSTWGRQAADTAWLCIVLYDLNRVFQGASPLLLDVTICERLDGFGKVLSPSGGPIQHYNPAPSKSRRTKYRQSHASPIISPSVSL